MDVYFLTLNSLFKGKSTVGVVLISKLLSSVNVIENAKEKIKKNNQLYSRSETLLLCS